MAENQQFTHWLMTVALPIAVSLFGIYNISKSKAETLEKRLTKLEVLIEMQGKILDSHNIRLNKHEEEQKVMVGLVEQIRSLTNDIGDLRSDFRDFKKQFLGGNK